MSREDSMNWRLLCTPPATGAENMALDQAILEAVSRGEAPPTLRLYSWQPPCLSLGHSQSLEDVDPERLAAHGWQLIRRPTGGRAILHADELTYSVAAPATHPDLSGTVLGSYRRISLGLMRGLTHLGLEADIQPEVRLTEAERDNPICFEVPSSYEITARGRKLIGSAQVRRQGGVLQHGSLPLHGDIGRICLVLRFDSEVERASASARLAQRAATLEDLLGHAISWDEAAQAMVRGFSEALGWELASAEPTVHEGERAARLRDERFLTPAHRPRG
jgi:lipoate-protein ligase A